MLQRTEGIINENSLAYLSQTRTVQEQTVPSESSTFNFSNPLIA